MFSEFVYQAKIRRDLLMVMNAYAHWSGKKVYNWLRFELNFRTEAGKKHFSLGNIFRNLSNPFYYGMFEYPKNSGQWYKGKHEPIITKELFDLAQSQLKSNVLRIENQEFAFTKLMVCGLCESGISACEKWKKQKNGNVHRYVYYGCTKAKDKHCKCGYIEEKELIKQFESLLENIDINEIEIKEKIKVDIDKFMKLQKFMLGTKDKIDINTIDIRGYAKYVLREGTDAEKRELLSCLKSKITLKEKQINLKT